MDEALDRWLRLVGDRKEFDGVVFGRAPKVSRTEKRRFWRCGLADGSNNGWRKGADGYQPRQNLERGTDESVARVLEGAA